MGRPRKVDKTLPPGVYVTGQRTKTYYVLSPKYQRLGSNKSEMYAALAKRNQLGGMHTMHDVIAKYIAEKIERLAPTSQTSYKKNLKRIASVFGDMNPRDITHEDVCQYHELRTEAGPTVANRELSVLRVLFNHCRRWCDISDNPCTGVEKNKEAPDSRYVTDKELALACKLASDRDRLIIRTLYATGQRITDVLRMQVSDLKDEGIELTQSKTAAALLIEYDDNLLQIVAAAKAERAQILLGRRAGMSPYLFVNHTTGDKIQAQSFNSAWHRLMLRCIEHDPTFERFKTRQIRAKARTDGDDKFLLGHRNPDQMDRIYYRKAKTVTPVGRNIIDLD